MREAFTSPGLSGLVLVASRMAILMIDPALVGHVGVFFGGCVLGAGSGPGRLDPRGSGGSAAADGRGVQLLLSGGSDRRWADVAASGSGERCDVHGERAGSEARVWVGDKVPERAAEECGGHVGAGEAGVCGEEVQGKSGVVSAGVAGVSRVPGRGAWGDWGVSVLSREREQGEAGVRAGPGVESRLCGGEHGDGGDRDGGRRCEVGGRKGDDKTVSDWALQGVQAGPVASILGPSDVRICDG